MIIFVKFITQKFEKKLLFIERLINYTPNCTIKNLLDY